MPKDIKKVNALIARIQAGDKKAPDLLFAEIGGLLLNVAKKYLYDKSLAEDLLSDVFLELYSSGAKTFDSSFNGINWLFTIVKNKAYHYNLKEGKTVNIDESEGFLQNFLKTDEHGDSAVENVDLRAALDTLSTEENRMLYLKFWEGLTVREIAKAVGLPKSTVHGLIKGALKKVGKFLDE